MGKQNIPKYTEEFRRSSAKHAKYSDQPIKITAKNLGINAKTLHNWVNKYYPGNPKVEVSELVLSPEEELKLLRKQLTRVTMERDILKKATAYFAGETL